MAWRDLSLDENGDFASSTEDEALHFMERESTPA